MFLILISWIYISCISYCIGIGFHNILKNVIGKNSFLITHFSIVCISGLLVTVFISSFLCLFIPLAFTSNATLLVFAIVCAVIWRKNLLLSIKSNSKLLKQTPWLALLICTIYLIIVAQLSYAPSSHNDDGLYYSTSIKWLQEYGTVKGLANINPRIAFNSTWLVLQAQYSFPFLKLGLFNDLNGLLVFYMFVYACGGVLTLLNGNQTRSAILRAIFILPALAFHHSAVSDFMLFNVNFLSSASADIPATLLVWLIIVLLMELFDTEPKHTGMQHVYEVLVIFYTISAITIKVVTIPLIIILLFYFFRSLKIKDWKQLKLIFIICFIPVLPWIARNVLISGYLLFPFSAFDVFDFDWKLPIENVLWHENSVKSFAIEGMPNTVHETNKSNLGWLVNWFQKQTFINTVILLFIAASSFIYFFMLLYFWLSRKLFLLKSNKNLILILVTIFSGILFWLFKGPDFRFGYGFTVIYCMLAITLFVKYFLAEYVRYIGWVAAGISFSLVFFIYFNDFKTGITDFFNPPLVYRMPKKINQVELNNNQPIYLVSGADIWNAPLPAATEEEYMYIKPALRKNTIIDGFKALNKKH